MKTGPSNRACWPLVPGTGRVVEGDPGPVSSGLFPLCDCGRSDLRVRAPADSSVYCALRRSRTLHLSFVASFFRCALLQSEWTTEDLFFLESPSRFLFRSKRSKIARVWTFLSPVCLSDCSFVWAFLPSLLLLLQHLVDRRTSGVLPISGTEELFLHLFVNVIPVSLSSKMVLGAGSYGT